MNCYKFSFAIFLFLLVGFSVADDAETISTFTGGCEIPEGQDWTLVKDYGSPSTDLGPNDIFNHLYRYCVEKNYPNISTCDENTPPVFRPTDPYNWTGHWTVGWKVTNVRIVGNGRVYFWVSNSYLQDMYNDPATSQTDLEIKKWWLREYLFVLSFANQDEQNRSLAIALKALENPDLNVEFHTNGQCSDDKGRVVDYIGIKRK